MAQPQAITAEPALIPSPPPAAKPKSTFLLGPRRDAVLLIFSPLLALVVGYVAFVLPENRFNISFFDSRVWGMAVLAVSFTHAHLFAVVFRSHGNRSVFREFPLRFTLVPALVFGAMAISPWILMLSVPIATFWDVYHSAMQNFGIGRIYDVKRGANPLVGRRMDMAMSLALYVGPVLAGAKLITHLESFNSFNDIGQHLFDAIPLYGHTYHWVISMVTITASLIVTVCYVLFYVRLARTGQPISWQKVALYVSTLVCSICAWGFNSFGAAFIIMNFFHALQYFTIVWWAEGKNLQSLFRVSNLRAGATIAAVLLVTLSGLYGFFIGFGYSYMTTGRAQNVLMALVNTVALMHFWYDGFVWSVRKKAVA